VNTTDQDSAAPSVARRVDEIAEKRNQILNQVHRRIVGQDQVLNQLLTAFIIGGHSVLRSVPGLAKTLMVRTLSETLSLEFQRIQFTPDLMPSDITGSRILEEDQESGSRSFKFRKGPIFTNILLADEINRTPPKTQAALLEAMEEKQVSSGRNVFSLPDPFVVLATQNPIEQEGTYVLPEAQLDRFLFMIKLDYSSEDEEQEILTSTTRGELPDPEQVMSKGEIRTAQTLVRKIPVSDHVSAYATRLMRATRPDQDDAEDFIQNFVKLGCSPRAGQALLLAGKANALLQGRTEVACEDIREFAHPVLRHRILLNFAATSEGIDVDDVIDELIETVPEAPA